MNMVGKQMQQDRIDGNSTYQEHDERIAHLAAMGAVNTVPPLPKAPCIKIKATGEIHIWSHFFAARPDLCENCDEYGNTDPVVWNAPKVQKTEPTQYAGLVNPKMQSLEKPTLPVPPDLMFSIEGGADLVEGVPAVNKGMVLSGSVPGDVPQINTAPTVLGIPTNFTQDYTDPIVTKAALPLPKKANTEGNSVMEITQEAFSQHN